MNFQVLHRCFKCGMVGHHKSHCRFTGSFYQCNALDQTVAICKYLSPPWRPINSSWPPLMAGSSPHLPIIIPPFDETCEQLEFFSSCAIITPHAPQLTKNELEHHLMCHWPETPAWEVFDFVNGKFLIKFPSVNQG